MRLELYYRVRQKIEMVCSGWQCIKRKKNVTLQTALAQFVWPLTRAEVGIPWGGGDAR